MKSLIFLSLLTSVFAFSSYTYAETNSCFKFYSRRIHIVSSPDLGRLSKGEAQIFKWALKAYEIETNRVLDVLSPVMKVPANLKINLSSVFIAESANVFGNTIDMSSRRLRQVRDDQTKEVKVFSKNPQFNLPLLRHELGHPIFQLALEEKHPWLSDFAQLTRDFQARKVPGHVYALSAAKNIKRIEKLRAYHEFFADFLSVVFSEDPNAVKDALSYSAIGLMKKSGQKKMKKENSLRTFIDYVRPETQATSHHGILWQARKFVWDSYLKRPEILFYQKAQIIKAVMDILVNETEWVLTQDLDPMKNQELINSHLIESLVKSSIL